jgi:hypothetical protein
MDRGFLALTLRFVDHGEIHYEAEACAGSFFRAKDPDRSEPKYEMTAF